MSVNGKIRMRARRRWKRFLNSKQSATVQVPSVITPPVSQVDPGLALLQLLKDVSRGICAAIVERLDAAPDFVQADLENAIYVSYLENVFLGRDEERYRAARSSLSGRLQAALADLEDHWKKIAEWKLK